MTEVNREALGRIIERILEDESFREELRRDPGAALKSISGLGAAEIEALGTMDWTLPAAELEQRLNKGYRYISDRALKKDVAPTDCRAVLETLATVPVARWSYISEPALHMGPMAQDFHAAFGLGGDDRTIHVADASGVAMAAIQGLYELVRALDARIQALEGRNNGAGSTRLAN